MLCGTLDAKKHPAFSSLPPHIQETLFFGLYAVPQPSDR
jgi:hypothetical protein